MRPRQAILDPMDTQEALQASSTEERILDAALRVLAAGGIAGTSMRAVANEAGVAVGLANYHFNNKSALVSAALVRIGEHDLEIHDVPPGSSPDDALRASINKSLDMEFLTAEHLSLRLQLWSLAGVDPTFAEINQESQQAYLAGLSDLIAAARPDLDESEIHRRATDILVIQNGVWLTAILIFDLQAIERARSRCMEIAFE